MKNAAKLKPVALLSALMLAGYAAAGITLLKTEVSSDGHLWSNDLTVRPGAKVQVRITTSFVGSERVYGFNYITIQPIIENWGEGDRVEPYVRTGNLNDGGYARDKPLPGEHAFGRMYHFAQPRLGAGVSTPLAEHIHTIDGQRYLRIAQSATTNWIGEGPISGTRSSNNFSGGGGIPLTQVRPGTPISPVNQNVGTQDVVLFKFMISVDADVTNRTLVANVPPLACTLSDGQRIGAWYTTPGFAPLPILHAPVESWESRIHVTGPVPAPASAAAFAICAAASLRRRRA